MYSVNFNRLVRNNIWAALTKTKYLTFLHVLLFPIKSLHSYVLQYINRTQFDVFMNGQTTKLIWALSNLLAGTVVTIGDASDFNQKYIYLEVEQKPLYLPTFIGGEPYDFYVQLESINKPNEVEIRKILDRYKLPTKRYIIIWV